MAYKIFKIILFLFLLSIITSAVDEVQQEGIKSVLKQINGSIIEMEWCGTNEIYNDETDRVKVVEDVDESFDTRLFILSTDGQVYKTNNYGKTWQNLSLLFKNDSGAEEFQATEVSISPIDGKSVFIWGEKDTSYFSDKCGSSWKKIIHPPGLFDFRFHRTNKVFINDKMQRKQQEGETTYQIRICGELEEDCNSKLKILFMSKDGGNSFSLLASNVLEATWNRNMYYMDSNDQQGIIAAIEENKQPRLVFSDDYFENVTTIYDGADNFFQAQFFLFITIKPTNEKKNYELRIASLFNNFKSIIEPQKVELPFESEDHLSFTILVNDGPKVFISIVHQNDGFKQNNVYVSDWRGYQLSLALLYNVRSEEGDCDFERVSSNEGVFIANTFDSEKVNALKKLKTKKEINLNVELFHFKKSVISFDDGSNWHPLKAPELRLNGKKYNCSGDCSLHLVGRTFQIKKIYIFSSTNAPGLIIGIGNVGSHLSYKPSEMYTYLSTDGGHVWTEILKGPHIFEIGDHGGLILAADGYNSTNIVKYSWDEGKTWGEHKLNTPPFLMETITTEPNNMEQKFIIHGTGKDSQNKKFTIISEIDLTDLHTRGCSGAEHPGRPNSDYEIWIPTNFQGDQCVLGRKIKYVRRKPGSLCYNSINVDQKTMIEECPCTFEDFECDFGFFRKENSGECHPMNSKFSSENLEKPPQDCYYSYLVSKGYRKGPGVFCMGGVDLSPEIKMCPPKIVEARVEENSEEYLLHKKQEERMMEVIKQEREKVKAKIVEQQGNDNEFWSRIIMYLGGVVLLGAAIFYYSEQITNCVFGKKQLKNEKAIYSPLGIKKEIKNNLFNKSKSTEEKVRVNPEDNYYDDEDHEFVRDNKPVLQRDQDGYDLEE